MERHLAAILAVDVVGYSRLMREDEAGTLNALRALRKELVAPEIAKHKGRIVKLMGDGLLAEFASVVEAVHCAVQIQAGTAKRNDGVAPERQICLRIGVNLGDVIVEDDDIYGDGVNVAARLEGLARPGGICISDMVHQNVKAKLALSFEDLGPQQLKNIAEPIHAYRIVPDALATPAVPAEAQPLLLPDKPSLAVLPFTNMSGDPEQEYFSDGITEDIITELSRFRSLFVIARNSSFHYKGLSPKIQDIGRELGVQYVVEGSVRKAGNRVRVTAQLVEAETGNHVWAERYDRELEDIFAVQDEVVREIASAVPGRLNEAATDRARRKPSESLTAYDYLLRGEWHQMGNYGTADALPLFEKAIEIDPRCARAYCRLAAYHGYSVFAHGTSVEEARRLAQSFADRALASDPGDPLVQVIAAQTYQMIGNHDLARRHIEKAIALNPNDITVIRFAEQILAYLGDHVEALKWNSKYLRLDPHFAEGVRETLFDTYYMTRRYEDAIASFQGWPNPPPHMYCELAAGYAQLGRMDDARAAVAEFERIRPAGYDFAMVSRAHARMCRRQKDADHWLEGYRKAGIEV